MKVATKKIDKCRRELFIEVPKESVQQKMEEIYAEVSKRAHIKGFRPGKAPRDVIEKHHSELVKEETLKDLIPSSYQQALEKEKLEPVDLPEVSEVELKDGILSFKAKVEIKPDIEIKNYKGLKVRRKKVQVTDDDMAKSLESLKTMKGMPKEAAVDDSFAKSLGYATAAELQTSIRKQLELFKEQQSREEIEHQIIEQLLKGTSFEVPQGPVKKQLEYMLEDAKRRLSYQGVKKEDVEKKQDELRTQLVPDAEKAIRVFFIFEAIAQLEKIEVKENEQLSKRVMEFLLKEAQWTE